MAAVKKIIVTGHTSKPTKKKKASDVFDWRLEVSGKHVCSGDQQGFVDKPNRKQFDQIAAHLKDAEIVFVDKRIKSKKK